MKPEQLTTQLSRNVQTHRQARGWTQRELAERAGVPRPTITRLESGAPNPTFVVVARVAAALDVSLEELVAVGGTGERLVPAGALPQRIRRGVVLRQVLPEPIPGLLVERMTFPPGARLTGAPHAPGSQEYLVCESGHLRLRTPAELFHLDPGDVAVYAGDQPHSYTNPSDETAVGYTFIRLDDAATRRE